MANQIRNPGVASTLTGGIQDISALLPLIGTDQCETHMGSALCGGYLYAAATPLSIFGSLGIVKAGISILVSSISIPKFWVSRRNLRPSGAKGKSKHSLFLGARLLQDAGFKLQGDVAPLIGMDGTLFKAETRLIRMLEEKHIDNPENVSITWKSNQWNTMLIFFTILAAVMSGAPYFALTSGPISWRPMTNTPGLFPLLRTVGSCIASVCCQFLIQSRVISSMKYRILFMDVHRRLSDGFSKDNKDGLNKYLEKNKLQWDPNLPAEQCIYNLDRFLASTALVSQTKDEYGHISIEMENSVASSASSVISTSSTPPPSPISPPNEDFEFNSQMLQNLHHKHFPSPTIDCVVVLFYWILLLLSLPAAVAGYIGCFTLVSATPSWGNGPLVWLGMEASLSVVRILIWAWNPSFDESTEITVELKLNEHRPLITSDEHKPSIHRSTATGSNSLTLIPEPRFLEGVTAYSGPLDQFRTSENVALYFTLMSDYSSRPSEFGRKLVSLLMTSFDFNTRVGVTLIKLGGEFYYFDADVRYDTADSQITATLQLPMTRTNNHSWRIQDGGSFDHLEAHYNSVVRALNTRVKGIAQLKWKWNLSQNPTLHQFPTRIHSHPYLTSDDLLYLNRGYEHHLKTELLDIWSRWIIETMHARAEDAQNDCYEALADRSSQKAQWELTELDRLLEREWVIRELALFVSSTDIEEILRSKMEQCIDTICKDRGDKRLEQRMRSAFTVGRRKRLERERGDAKKRMVEAMHEAGERSAREGRPWKDQGAFMPQWQEDIDFVDKRWSDGVNRTSSALGNGQFEIDYLAREYGRVEFRDPARYRFVKQIAQRFAHWRSQREYERLEMDGAIERIRGLGIHAGQMEMDNAYEYPEPDQEATSKFARLQRSSSKGKACSASVYNAWHSDGSANVVYDIVKKSTTRSVNNVDPEIVHRIPPNDHPLFLSCYGRGQEPAFVQQNRDRWWDQQTTNSALFYFIPTGVSHDSCDVFSGPIAHIFIFLANPSRVRLRLLHRADINFGSLSIQRKNGENLYILSDIIPESGFKLQDIELQQFAVERHELQLVASQKEGVEFQFRGVYYLRDILVEFLDVPVQTFSRSDDINRTDDAQPTVRWSSDKVHKPLPVPPPYLDTQDIELSDKLPPNSVMEDVDSKDHPCTPDFASSEPYRPLPVPPPHMDTQDFDLGNNSPVTLAKEDVNSKDPPCTPGLVENRPLPVPPPNNTRNFDLEANSSPYLSMEDVDDHPCIPVLRT